MSPEYNLLTHRAFAILMPDKQCVDIKEVLVIFLAINYAKYVMQA